MISREKTVPALLTLLLVVVMYVVSGCAQLGLEAPATPGGKVAAAYATATAVNQSATMLLNAKKISSKDAQNVLDSTRAARRGIDVAKALAAIDPKASDAKLRAQQEILKALQAYLASKGG